MSVCQAIVFEHEKPGILVLRTTKVNSFAGQMALFIRNAWRMADVVVNRYLGRPPHYLPFLLMFLTNRCNLRCRMCGVCEYNPLQGMSSELSTEEWKGVLRSAVNLGTTLVSITGGEPLLRPDLYEIIRYARDLGLNVHICTNGTLLNERNVDRLCDSGVDTVSVSIESPEPEIHEYLRGKNTFGPAVNGIRLLRERAPEVRVGINYVITTASFHNMDRMIAFAEDLDVHQVKFAPIHTNLLHRHKPVDDYGELIFRKQQLPELEQEIDRLIRAVRQTRLRTTSLTFLSGMTELYRGMPSFRCFAGYATCAVNPEGRVAPCCDMDSVLSVRDQSLEAIWHSEAFHAMRQRVQHCQSACWDTTNTEISLRLAPLSLFRDLGQTWRDVAFYFGSNSRRHK